MKFRLSFTVCISYKHGPRIQPWGTPVSIPLIEDKLDTPWTKKDHTVDKTKLICKTDHQPGTQRVEHDVVIKWKHFPRYWPFMNSPVTDEFPAQRPVSRSFDVYFDLRLE